MMSRLLGENMKKKYFIFIYPEPKADRLAYSIPIVRRLSVCRRRPSSTMSNMNISATSGPITMKFDQKHHWEWGKAALVLGQIGSKLLFPWQQIAPIGL